MSVVASVVTVTTNPTLIKDTNANRNIDLVLYNGTTDTAYLGGSTAMTTATGLPFVPAGTFSIKLIGMYNDKLYGVTATTATALNVLSNKDTTS